MLIFTFLQKNNKLEFQAKYPKKGNADWEISNWGIPNFKEFKTEHNLYHQTTKAMHGALLKIVKPESRLVG